MGVRVAILVEQPPLFLICYKCKGVLEEPVWACSKQHPECRSVIARATGAAVELS